MRKLMLALVLLIGMTAAIFCMLLSSGFLAVDRSSASRKEQVSTREENEENRRPVSDPRLPNARQFARMVSLDAHLLGRGFTDEQVKLFLFEYCTAFYRCSVLHGSN